MSDKTTYRNMDGTNVTSHIVKGKSKLFERQLKAYDYATLKRSYSYPVQILLGDEEELIGYGYAVPQ